MPVRGAVVLLAAATLACGGSRQTAGVATPAPVAAGAGTEYTAQVDSQLVRLTANARAQGFARLVSGPIYGRVADDGVATHEVTVTGGSEYALLGACDDDCSDLDLKIFDGAGAMLMQDVEADATPVLTFIAQSSGRYRVEAVMANCSHPPCFYGIQLLSK